MDAEGAVRIAFRVVVLTEFVFHKGLGVVVHRIRHDGRGIQANERSVHDAQFIELAHQ